MSPPRRLASPLSRLWICVALAALLALFRFGDALIELFAVPKYVFPPPTEILKALFTHRRLLLTHLPPTILEVLYGFAIGSGAAIAIAIATIQWRHLQHVLLSLAVILRSVPIVAITPILALWLGLGMAPRVTIVALLTFLPILVMTVEGLTSVDPVVLDLMETLNASRSQVLAKIRIPAAAPFIFSGLRSAAPTAVFGALVGEWLGAGQGIGHLMAMATFEFRTDLLWGTIVVATCLGVGAYGAVVWLERWLAPWAADLAAATGLGESSNLTEAPLKTATDHRPNRRRPLPSTSHLN